MRLYKYVCALIAVIVFITGCANSGTDDLPDGIKLINGMESGREGTQIVSRFLEENYTYTIKMATYSIEDVNIEYPQIQGLKDKKREEKINQIIKDHFLEGIIGRALVFSYPNGLKEYHKKLECRITLQSYRLLSFYYVGEGFFDGGRTSETFYAMTLDIKEAKELWLSDFVDIDETLVERIKRSTDISNHVLEENPNNENLRKGLLLLIQNQDVEQYISYLVKGMDGFALEQDALIVEMGVATSAGDYVLIKLPGRIEGNRFVFDEP